MDFYLYLAAAIVTIRQLIRRARTLGYSTDNPPTQVTPIAGRNYLIIWLARQPWWPPSSSPPRRNTPLTADSER